MALFKLAFNYIDGRECFFINPDNSIEKVEIEDAETIRLCIWSDESRSYRFELDFHAELKKEGPWWEIQ